MVSYAYLTYSCSITELFAYSLWLDNVNGSLTSLGDHGGFRKYVKVVADDIGVKGHIKRERLYAVSITVEGTNDQIKSFFAFVKSIAEQEMCEIHFFNQLVSRGLYTGFKILRNASTQSRTGEYSDKEYDAISQSSADRQVLGGSQVQR